MSHIDLIHCSMPAGLAMVFEVAETLKIVFLFYAVVLWNSDDCRLSAFFQVLFLESYSVLAFYL